ncbi:hypothetical protein GOBAR_DD22280 [Gossypium barbadense]|nr:hypothetical protein GOBAR_DD22280 [Gossypium barbadense]
MVEEGQVISCLTVESWKEQLQLAEESKKLIFLGWTWCRGTCHVIAPVLVDLAKKLPNVTYLKVDVDELKTVAEEWNVEAMPTFIYLKEGNLIDKVVGAKKDELQQRIVLTNLVHKYEIELVFYCFNFVSETRIS